ncbi:Bug family tripartite tricarboxylate transporter substrate binding protein [Jezberella montanilacus]|uniref:Bug family tripartite tricarboxylate transporter substrate binding protein n=1 Tax=Jezberella montanilacus TaxID=323426 RepID=UPI002180BF90|nr:tripartite tricarboxylate transporter substrate binding protein [Jezberella montanilacus]
MNLCRVFLWGLALSTSGQTFATYPERAIKLIVPFAAGGGTDLVARVIGGAMTNELHQTVIIENKPGGSTIIGTDALAKSAPDGYTLVMATFAHAVNPSLKTKLPYNQDKDFAPVCLIGISPNVLVVSAASPYQSVKELLEAVKANPGKFSYASQGSGTSAHLAGELFASLTGAKLLHVPYKGAAPALTDLMGRQVDIMFATASAVGNLIEAGKLRALAVTTTDRSTSPVLAKVPTIAESGVPGYSAGSWYGVFAPAGTPKEIIAQLNAAITKGALSSSFKNQVESEGLVIKTGTPEDFAQFEKTEELRWRTVIKDGHITED